MSDLMQFLRKKSEEEKSKAVVREELKRLWLEALKELFDDIKSWVADASQEGLLQIRQDTEQLAEGHLGRYQVPVLFLRAGASEVLIKPIGRIIVGAQGRVDMITHAEQHVFIYASAQDGWLYVRDKRKGIYDKLTKELFTELLMGMLK